MELVQVLVFESILDFLVLFHFENGHTQLAHEVVGVILVFVKERDVEVLVQLADVKVKDTFPFLAVVVMSSLIKLKCYLD